MEDLTLGEDQSWVDVKPCMRRLHVMMTWIGRYRHRSLVVVLHV